MEELEGTAVPMEVMVRIAVVAEAEGEDLEVAVDLDMIGALIEEAEVGQEAEEAWGKCSHNQAHTRVFLSCVAHDGNQMKRPTILMYLLSSQFSEPLASLCVKRKLVLMLLRLLEVN